MVVATREVPVDPPSEQNRPQQVGWIDQVVGLLGKEMAIGELGMAVVGERESTLALGQVEKRGARVNLPLPPLPQSPQAEEMRPPQQLEASSCGEREESQLSSPVEGAGAAAADEGKAFTSFLLFLPGSGPSAGATERGGAAIGSVVEEEEPVPLAPWSLASSSKAFLLSFPDIVSTSKRKRRVRWHSYAGESKCMQACMRMCKYPKR